MIRLLFHESMQQRIEHSPILAQSTEEIGVNPLNKRQGAFRLDRPETVIWTVLAR